MSNKTNKFRRAIHHLKSDQIDERMAVLEAAPTNSTQNLMTVEPSVQVASTYETVSLGLDFDKGNDDDGGTDTSGIFESDGTILTLEPDVGDTSYILGPMASMWYAWGNFTRIGYIQQDTRRMVNLGTLTGPLGSWDGSADGFTSYGQLTLAQADWFRTIGKKDGADNNTPNYRAFYPGPPSGAADSFGRYLACIVGEGKTETTGNPRSTSNPKNAPEDPSTQFSGELNQYEKNKKKPKPDRDDYPTGRAGAKKYQDDLNKWKDEQKEEGEEKPDSKKPDKEPSDYKSPKDRGGQGGNDQEWRDKGDKTGDPASDPASDYTAPKDRGGQGDTDGVDPNEPGLLDKAKEAWDWYGDNKEAVDAAAGSVMNAVDAAMAIASVVGVIFPEVGTSAAGALGIASLANKMKKAYNAVKAGKSVADVIGGKNKGLSGAGSFDVGATGVKKTGYDALNPNQIGPKAQHTGSKGILSPGGGMVYSAPKVGQTGPSAINPGTGASKYTQYGSNPFSQSSKGGGDVGGVIGSIVNKGNKSIGAIEPQSTQTPAQFNKSSKIFNDIMNGKYQNSPTAQKIYQKGIDAGFTTGGGSIKFSDIPKQTSVPNVGKTQGNLTKFVSTKGKIKESFNYLIENNSKKEIKLQGDKEDIMIMHLLKKPEIIKKLPLIIKGLELETEIADAYGILFGYEDKSVGKKKVKESNSLRKVKFVVEDDNAAEKTFKELQGKLLSESKRRILREIKKPVKVPELQKKFKGIKPKVKKKGDYKIVGGGLMKDNIAPPEFSPTRENRLWRKYEVNQNRRASQEKKNQVLELIGEGDHQWNHMLGNERWRSASQMKKFYGDHDYLYDYYYGGKKHKVLRKEGLEKDFLVFIEDENGFKDTILQSELNELLAEERDKEDFKEYYMKETEQKEREKNFDRATKLKSIVGRIKRGDIKPEYPNEPPPKMINGYHPKFGKKYKHDKLDPVSARSMPRTGDPEIDSNVEKAKRQPK